MAVMDEFKEEREALKRGTPKQKLAYFWYYYKWHVIISVIIIGMLVSFIYQFVNRKDTAFNAVLLNASLLDQMSSEQPDFLTDFAEKEGIDLNTSDITFDTSIRIVEDSMDEVSVTSTQKLMVYVAANELDSMITDFDSFQKYANSSRSMICGISSQKNSSRHWNLISITWTEKWCWRSRQQTMI